MGWTGLVFARGAGAIPELRIHDTLLSAQGIRRRAEVTWQDGPVRQVAVSEFDYQADYRDDEKIRWYLEDYADFPFDPAPALAREAEARLEQIGAVLFRHLFSGREASGIWERVLGQLGQVRIEVETGSAEAPGLPWELLRDPAADVALARDARAFVRNDLGNASHRGLPESAGDRLRVLLVICRPGGGDDVPFRSVARRLVRGAAQSMDGLDLDVLRPATFQRLSEVLHAAAADGHPYHVVHFDGHGTYLDLADLGQDEEADGGPVRAGQHGYLIFEAPGDAANEQYVGGPALGTLLADTKVPVLVLNACRSAYSEPHGFSGDSAAEQSGDGGGQSRRASSDETTATLAADARARIRAYGSLAAEVADAGVPGVVAMRYNVYVVTAAQFVANLYAGLLAGSTLGEAATAARRALAASPALLVGAKPAALQDWTVPVVYEAAPLALLQPLTREVPPSRRTPPDSVGTVESSLPGLPDVGLVGRDETLLALDRAFDTQPIVLLQGCAGAGKSSTAAEFARWYQATGGLDTPGHPDITAGPVLWSSFQHRLPPDGLLDGAAGQLAGLLEKEGIRWQAITDTAERQDLLLQILTRVPVLWVWDDVEPVTGFPAGSLSAWTAAEQTALAAFLGDLGRTRCKVLLVSRRDERRWLGELPARVQLPPMPMQESLELAAALAARHGCTAGGTDWQPLLRYAAGNPLTITALMGRAVRHHMTASEAITAFADRLFAGDMDLEAAEDAALGRTRSLAASLSYGFDQGFSDADRDQLALLHLFRGTADANALALMGMADDDAVPELAGFTAEVGVGLLDRAAAIGMLTPYGGGYYQVHPALPWYMTAPFTAAYGQPGTAATRRATRAYTRAIATLSHLYYQDAQNGHAEAAVNALRIEEGNLRHALDLARSGEHWDDALACLQGLHILYLRTGRGGEWARIVGQITPDFIHPETGGPLPDREMHWGIVVGYRTELAIDARDWPAATTLLDETITFYRARAADTPAAPDAELIPAERDTLNNLGACLFDLGQILFEQGDGGCIALYQEALGLSRRLGASTAEAETAIELGNAYSVLRDLRDLDQAEEWYQYSFDHRTPSDRHGRAKSLGQLAHLAHERFIDAHAARADWDVLEEHLHAALDRFQGVFDLIEADDDEHLALTYSGIGGIYTRLGDYRQALDHLQQALWHEEKRGATYRSGQDRFNIAGLLAADDRPADALQYARAALANYESIGPGAAQEAARTRQILTSLELTNLGESLAAERRFGEAAAVHEKAAAFYRETGDSRGERTALNSLGRALTEARRFGDAITAHQAAAALCRDFRDRHGEGVALANLGRALTGAHRSDEAVAAGQDAVAIFQQTGSRRGEATALNNLGLGLTQLRRFDDAITAHQQAAAIYRDIQRLDGEAEVLINLGIALVELRRFPDAIIASQNATAIFQQTGDRHGEGMALNVGGLALIQLRRFDDAIAAHQQAAEIFQETHDLHSEGEALTNLGNAQMESRRLDDAIAAHQAALVIFREIQDGHSEGRALVNFGIVLKEMGRFGDAIAAHHMAAAIFGETHDLHGQGTALVNLGNAVALGNQPDEAIRVCKDAAAIFRRTEDRHGEGMALSSLAMALLQALKFEDAITTGQNAAAIFRDTGDRHREAKALMGVALALLPVQQFDDAIATGQDAAAIFRDTGDLYGEGLALIGLASALRQVGRFGDAVTAFEAAAAKFHGMGDYRTEAETLLELASVLGGQERWDDAIIACQKGAAIFQQTGDRRAARRALIAIGAARAAQAAERFLARRGRQRT